MDGTTIRRYKRNGFVRRNGKQRETEGDRDGRDDMILYYAYYATLLIPWWYAVDGLNEDAPEPVLGQKSALHYLSPPAFTVLMHEWSSPGAHPIFRARYCTFHNMVHSLNSPYMSRLVSQKWRFQAADVWEDMDQVEVPVPATNHGQHPQFDPAILAAAKAAADQL